MPTLDELFAAVQELDVDAQERIRLGLSRLMEMVTQTARGRLMENIHTRWPEQEDEILMALRPAVLVRLDQSGVRPAVGASKAGGLPDLPRGATWPRAESGRPLAFLAQFDLGAAQELVTNLALPVSGLLSIFCSLDEDDLRTGRPESAVLYHRAFDPPLEPLTPPDELEDAEGLFARQALELEQGFTLAPGRLDADLTEQVARLLPPGQGSLLGQIRFQRPELQAAFNPITDELLLHLQAFGVICSPGSPDSLFGEGAFYLVIDRGDLAQGALSRANLFFDGQV